MRFEEALQALREYKKVRFKDWEFRLVSKVTRFSDEILETADEIQFRDHTVSDDDFETCEFELTWEEILSQKWGVVDENT